MAIQTSAIQSPPPPSPAQKSTYAKIIQNEIQTRQVLVLVTSDLIDTGRVWKQIKRWLIFFSAALDLPATIAPVLEETLQCCPRLSLPGRTRIGSQTNEELVFSITQCTLTKMVCMFMCARGGHRGPHEGVHWLMPFASIADNDLSAEMQNCTSELSRSLYYLK